MLNFNFYLFLYFPCIYLLLHTFISIVKNYYKVTYNENAQESSI